MSLFECQTEISSSKDKRYGERRRRALGGRQTGDRRGRRGQATLEGISRLRTACNQYSTLLSCNLEQDPALASLHIPLQPATSLPSAGGGCVGLAVGTYKHWCRDIPRGSAAACWPQSHEVSHHVPDESLCEAPRVQQRGITAGACSGEGRKEERREGGCTHCCPTNPVQ